MNKNALNLLMGLTLFTCTTIASAASSLIVTNPDLAGPYTTSSFAVGELSGLGEQSFNYGTLTATGAGTVTYTYIGSDAGYTNNFVTTAGTFTNHGATALGTTISQNVTGGNLNFSFTTNSPAYSVSNGTTITNSTDLGYGNNQGVFGIVQGSTKPITIGENTYQALLIYNDPVRGGDHDYNDLVVGVNISPVPEPTEGALLLSGIGLLGFIVARRKTV